MVAKGRFRKRGFALNSLTTALRTTPQNYRGCRPFPSEKAMQDPFLF
jgi:hypothetical protein